MDNIEQRVWREARAMTWREVITKAIRIAQRLAKRRLISIQQCPRARPAYSIGAFFPLAGRRRVGQFRNDHACLQKSVELLRPVEREGDNTLLAVSTRIIDSLFCASLILLTFTQVSGETSTPHIGKARR
jgi:hypothetical protein